MGKDQKAIAQHIYAKFRKTMGLDARGWERLTTKEQLAWEIVVVEAQRALLEERLAESEAELRQFEAEHA